MTDPDLVPPDIVGALDTTAVAAGPDPTLVRIARGGAFNLLGAFTGAIGSFVVVVIVGAHYSKAVTGAFLAATALFLILLAVAELGVDTGLLRYLPAFLLEGRRRDVRTCLRIALRPVYLVSIGFSVLLVVTAPWLGEHLVDSAASSASRDAFVSMTRVLAIGLPIAATFELVLATTRAYTTMRPTVLVDKIGRGLVQPVAVLAVSLAGGGPVALAIAFTAPYLPALAWAVAWAVRIAEREAEGAPVGPGQPTKEIRHEFWSYTRPRAVARICQVALQRADVILVAHYVGLRDAAVYGAASRLLVFGQLGVQAVQQVIQPHLSRLLARADRVGAERVFRASTAWLMAFGWPAYLVTAVAAPLMLSIFFRHNYSSGATSLVILSITMLVATACGPVDIVLLMAGRSGLSLFNNAAALVVDIAVDVVLIPRIGITGAAIGWAAALLVRNVLPLGQVLTTIGMSPFSRGVAWVAATSFVCFGLLPLLQRAVLGSGVVISLSWLVPCSALYLALLWRGRRAVELDAFAGLISRRRGSESVGATAT